MTVRGSLPDLSVGGVRSGTGAYPRCGRPDGQAFLASALRFEAVPVGTLLLFGISLQNLSLHQAHHHRYT